MPSNARWQAPEPVEIDAPARLIDRYETTGRINEHTLGRIIKFIELHCVKGNGGRE